MSSYGINPEKIGSYDGVFQSGLKVQDTNIDEQQLFDFQNGNCLKDIEIDKSGLYKPSELAGSSLLPTKLYPHGILEKADETYTDEDGNKCKVYKNDDGSYQVEKSNGFFGRLFGKTEIEQYDANGNLVAKQKDGVTYYYDENGNLTKTSQGSLGSSKVVLYNEDGSIQKEQERKITPNGEGHTTVTREYNEDGSYTEIVATVTDILYQKEPKTTVQTFDKNGNPTSDAKEVDENS